jgi:hypothetical protein
VARVSSPEGSPASVRGAKVVFVGAGPRAVSAVERLLSLYSALDHQPNLEIILVDPHEVGRGRVWRADQSPLLLNNSSSGDTTLFPDATVALTAPLRTGPTCYQWAHLVVDRSWPEALRSEAGELRPWSHPSRPLLGAYFRWVLDVLATSLPPSVCLTERRDRVVKIDDAEPGESTAQRVTLASGEELIADVVIFSMGFIPDRPSEECAELSRSAGDAGLIYMVPNMASEVDFDRIPAGEDVIVRGLGATLFDIVGILFEGRGGHYRTDSDHLSYRPSGREPRLLIGSNAGLPKRSQHPGPVPVADLGWFNDEWVDQILAEHADAHDSSFEDEVWPGLQDAISHVFESAPANRSKDDTYSWKELARPSATRVFESFDQWEEFLDSYLERELQGARGEPTSWLAARSGVLTARPMVARLDTGGVFSADSDRQMPLQRFYKEASQVTAGPPAIRFRQLNALIEAGLVVLTGPLMEVEVHRGYFRSRSKAIPDRQWRARTMVEAYLQFGDLSRSGEPLVGSLLASGKGSLGGSRDSGSAMRRSSFDIDPSSYAMKDRQGRVCTRRLVLGMAGSAHQRGVGRVGMPCSADPFFIESDRIATSVFAALGWCPANGRDDRGPVAEVEPGSVHFGEVDSGLIEGADDQTRRLVAHGGEV